MKYILILSIIAASLGGCVIVPAGHGDSRDGYYNQNDGTYRNYSYRGNQGYAYRDHGG
jgi:hypothetical protein